jgi:transcriptional regulator with XRE-family HTH domain
MTRRNRHDEIAARYCAAEGVITMNGPTVRRRRLGAELRTLREGRGLKLGVAADSLGMSPSSLSRIETGQGPCRLIYLNALLDLYEVREPAGRELLLALARDGNKRGWWDAYDGLLPSGMGMYVGLESDATRLRGFEPIVVHGLLQTPEYAHEVLRQMHPGKSGEDVARLVQLRMDRQQRLTADDSFELWLIHDETVLLRNVGGPQVMAGQLARLLEAADQPGITIQVLPLAAGAHAAMRGGFSILGFDAGDPAAYVEGASGVTWLERSGDLGRLSRTFDYLTVTALPVPRSRERISRALGELQHDTAPARPRLVTGTFSQRR